VAAPWVDDGQIGAPAIVRLGRGRRRRVDEVTGFQMQRCRSGRSSRAAGQVPAPLFGWMHEKPWKEARWCNCLDAADPPGQDSRLAALAFAALVNSVENARMP
jgi:hypothetical protein